MSLRLARSWANVHHTSAGAALLLVVLVMSFVSASAYVQEIGFIRLAAPTAALALLPIVAGTGAAMCSVRSFVLALPDPARARWARVLWALGAMGVAWLVANAATWLNSEVSVATTTRNVLIAGGLGLSMNRVAEGRYVWLPAVVLTLVAMLFGHPETGTGYYWWAVVLEEQATATQLAAAAGVYAIGLAVVTARTRAPTTGAAQSP